MKQIIILFSTGFFQVFFVSLNTYFISKEYYLGISIAAFMISLIWCFNVTKIAVGTWRDKITYSLGATAGSLSGVYVASLIS